jgi:hypothetical protein
MEECGYTKEFGKICKAENVETEASLHCLSNISELLLT